MSIPTTIRTNQLSTANPDYAPQASTASTSGARPKIRTTVPTFSLHHSELESTTPGNQATQGSLESKCRQVSAECAASFDSYQDNGNSTSTQKKKRRKKHQTTPEASSHRNSQDDGFVVFTKKKQINTDQAASTASPKTTENPQHSLSTKNSPAPQKRTQNDTPTAPRSASKTLQPSSQQSVNQKPKRNLKTDAAVDNFIIKVTNLNSFSSSEIRKQTTMAFHEFNKNTDYLTDDHRKKLLEIIPKISRLIDRKDLNMVAIVTILLSLAKTKFFNKLNSNSTSENEYIKYEQTCKNLIAKISDKLQTYEKCEARHWSNIVYSMKLIAEQALDLVDQETINKLVVKFNSKKQSLTGFTPQSISNMLLSLHKLLKFNKLDHRLPATYSSIEYLLQQIETTSQDFTAQNIDNTLFSVAELAKFPEFIKLISDNQNVIVLLLKEIINDKHSNWKGIEISLTIYGIANLLFSICLSDEFSNLAGKAYNVLYSKIPFMASSIPLLSSSFLLSGVSKLIQKNNITYNKPSKDIVMDIFLNKIIADPSIINNKEMYYYLHTVAFYQRYLNSDAIIKIMEGINFFMPDVVHLKTYFTGMGYLLVKIRDEIANDTTNKKLLAFEKKLINEIKKTWNSVRSNLENIDQETRGSIYNTCSLIDEITDLAFLPVSYPDIKGSQLEDDCLAIIKTLIPPSVSLKKEHTIDNLPPIDACLIYPDRSMLAIEIQGPGHYIDDKGEHPHGKHLFKMARLKKANIKVLEINAYKLSSRNNPQKTAWYLINLFAEHNIKMRPEYRSNIPKLLRDAGFCNDKLQTT